MAKTLTESALSTRAARAKLAPGAHFRGIDPEVHLGYRRGARGGVWFVRWRNGQGYRQSPIGVADDELREGTLDYAAAVSAARKAVEKARREVRAAADGPVVTVRTAITEYVKARDKRESERRKRPVHSDAWRLARYVIGRDEKGARSAIASTALADKALHSLRESDLQTWLEQLPDALKATSRRRLVNDLKAALNAAYAKHRRKLDPMLPSIIKHGLKLQAEDSADEDIVPVARDNQILSDAQIGALIRAAGEVDADDGWDGDLHRMVVVLAGTGARFSQAARMRVGDVQRAQRRLQVPVSRKGKGKSGAVRVAVGSDVLDVLQPVVTGRKPDAVLLERWRDKQVSSGKHGIRWERDKRGPWQTASELSGRPWKAIRERAGMPDVIPYALRHSSIVRGIRAGLPIRLVAAIHDTSVGMIEKHYSKWIVDGLDDLAARAVVPLVPTRNRVVRLTGRGR